MNESPERTSGRRDMGVCLLTFVSDVGPLDPIRIMRRDSARVHAGHMIKYHDECF